MKVYWRWYEPLLSASPFRLSFLLLNVCQKKKKRERDCLSLSLQFLSNLARNGRTSGKSEMGETWRGGGSSSNRYLVHGANKITRTEHVVCNSQVIRNQRRAASSNRAPDRIISSLDVKHIPPFIHCARIMQSKLHTWKYGVVFV